MSNKAIIAALLALMSASPMLSGCSEDPGKNKTAIERRPIAGVTLARVALVETDDYIEATGTIKAKTVSTLSSRTMGTVTAINFTEGAPVKAGRVLVTIESLDASEKVAGAEALQRESKKALEAAGENLGLMEATLARYKKLYEGKAISRHEFETIESRARTAKLEHERVSEAANRATSGTTEARVHKGYASVTAPYSGVVTEKKIDIGALASPGTPLLTIEDTSSFTLEAYADERLAALIKPGMGVEAIIESTGQRLSGRVTEASGAINPSTRTFLVKVALGGNDLRSGLYASVRFPAGKKPLLVVPSSSVIKKGQLIGVYVVDEQLVATYRLIRTGRTIGANVEVISGLDAGEQIITKGADGAFDGGIIGRGQ
ncbi:MAG: efflux RND transporter periplasmic adaptor subunit [Deltaproteobacteria bacterium]